MSSQSHIHLAARGYYFYLPTIWKKKGARVMKKINFRKANQLRSTLITLLAGKLTSH